MNPMTPEEKIKSLLDDEWIHLPALTEALYDLIAALDEARVACAAFWAYYSADHEKTGPGNNELQRLFDQAVDLTRKVMVRGLPPEV